MLSAVHWLWWGYGAGCAQSGGGLAADDKTSPNQELEDGEALLSMVSETAGILGYAGQVVFCMSL